MKKNQKSINDLQTTMAQIIKKDELQKIKGGIGSGVGNEIMP